jgi:type IV secretion system protein VirB5
MKTFAKFAVAAAAYAAIQTAALAQIPVTDALAQGQWIQQIVAMGKQYQELQNQYQQAKATYNSLNGTRSISGLLSNDLLSRSLPADYQQYLTAMRSSNGSGSGISASIAQIVRQNQNSNCAQSSAGIASREQECNKRWNAMAGQQLAASSGYEAADKDMRNLNQMLSSIQGSSDPKAIADLQARISLQQVKINSEQTKLATIKMLAEAEDKMVAQRRSDEVQAGYTKRGAME